MSPKTEKHGTEELRLDEIAFRRDRNAPEIYDLVLKSNTLTSRSLRWDVR